MARLDGKVALISGTAMGMGRAAALEFAAAGALVAGCDLDEEGAARTVALVEEAGGRMVSVAPVDLATEEGAAAWVRAAVDAFGRVDVLYNNASALKIGGFPEQPAEEWYFTIRNELHLVYESTRAAWPYLKERGGVVVNVASIAAHRGAMFAGQAAHGAAKGGVAAFTRHLVVSGAPYGIRANTISPGPIKTPATAGFFDDPEGPAKAVLETIPARRAGEPEDVARLAVFLASDDASFINGADIAIDGGLAAVAP
ncbi:SDR family oxidoreductase [Microbispora sp. NPDC046933]|uniref:SDR family NAD(P)-dependent oxidoreductase n=1 Tax=Microbispora sp. NPDC046933 TaxID=3155618 RepID=UPI0033C65F36